MCARPTGSRSGWRLLGGVPVGYPAPIVDHKAERQEALSRYERVKAARR